ncbi:hypothetical protein J1N35_015302 [Gossypium stocksii]|uniref:DUF4283 domain-containing protein n=1 Tax=Gossypium stocksii TaxID=47602 RepID=A0A9D3VXM1_9ROSI|nr:hypothetical protein J1N35_015302 [Gossypium stocksii]
MSSLGGNENSEANLVEELLPKKVRFGDKDDNKRSDMMIDLSIDHLVFWRDKLVSQSSKSNSKESDENEDFDILEGDIQKSFVNGVPAISFSDRIHQILIQGMDNTVVLKLLGRNTRYLYKHKILVEIGGLVGKVVKLDFNTDSKCGRYDHVKDNCSFKNTKINMRKESALSEKPSKNHSRVEAGQEKGDENFGPWMIIERRQMRKSRDNGQHFLMANLSIANSSREGQPNVEVVVEMGRLASDKHSAVVFSESRLTTTFP